MLCGSACSWFCPVLPAAALAGAGAQLALRCPPARHRSTDELDAHRGEPRASNVSGADAGVPKAGVLDGHPYPG